MTKYIVAVLCIVAVMVIGSTAAFGVEVKMVAPLDGPLYAVSAGTAAGEDGECNPILGGGFLCSDGIANEASITLSSRCGNSQGSGFCVIITPGEGLPDPLPDATNTLECPAEGMNYEVTDGGNGVCTMTDNKKPSGSVNCTQENTNNFASASCANGCGNTSGTGADCTPKSRE